MTDDLGPYPAYKDSGVDLLGQVPEHWEVRRLAAIGRLFKGNGGTKEDEAAIGVPCVRYGDIYMHHQFFVHETRSRIPAQRAADYTPIRYGDVLFAGSGETIDEIGKSVAFLIDEVACCGGDVVVFRPSIEVNAAFMGYATDSGPALLQKSRMGRGITVMHIYGDQLKNLWLALPSMPEQGAIVRYLNALNSRVGRYVRAKQSLTRLLSEQKRATIQRAMTRGLDPDVRLKPSGLDWLGDVPEHWEVRRNSQLFAQRNETGFESLPLLEVSLRTGVRLRSQQVGRQKRVSLDRDTYKRAAAGDIVYNMMRAWQGAIGVAPEEGLASSAYVVARPVTGINSRYFGNLFRTPLYVGEMARYSRGIAEFRNRLYWEDFKRMYSCCPPYGEQTAIAHAIDAAAAAIEAEIQGVRRQIELVNQYRMRVIADVVTGRRDVREASADLPDEGELSVAPIDETVFGLEDGAEDEEASLAEVEA